MRSQPMFGLTTTMSPREMKRFMPPSASTARRTSSSGDLRALGDRHLQLGITLDAKVTHLALAGRRRQAEAALIVEQARRERRSAQNRAGQADSL